MLQKLKDGFVYGLGFMAAQMALSLVAYIIGFLLYAAQHTV